MSGLLELLGLIDVLVWMVFDSVVVVFCWNGVLLLLLICMVWCRVDMILDVMVFFRLIGLLIATMVSLTCSEAAELRVIGVRPLTFFVLIIVTLCALLVLMIVAVVVLLLLNVMVIVVLFLVDEMMCVLVTITLLECYTKFELVDLELMFFIVILTMFGEMVVVIFVSVCVVVDVVLDVVVIVVVIVVDVFLLRCRVR